MTFFDLQTIRTLDDLKAAYRELAFAHHPDRGGDIEAMKAVNREFDTLYHRYEESASPEAASEYRSEFYTHCGWKGANYSRDIDAMEVARRLRKFISKYFNDFRFSVRCRWAGYTRALDIEMTEAPECPYIDPADFTEADEDRWWEVSGKYAAQSLMIDNLNDPAYDASKINSVWKARVREAITRINEFVQSYLWEDIDSMADYFNVNFYFSGVNRDLREVKIVPRVYKVPSRRELHVAGGAR